MSKTTVDRDQAIQALMTLCTKVNWDKIPPDVLQEIITDKDGETGRQFTAFLRNRGKMLVGELKSVTIDRTRLFNAFRFVPHLRQFKWRDPRALSIVNLDFTKIQFLTMLRDGEPYITGIEKRERLGKSGYICLDAGVFWYFWDNLHLIPESWKEKIDGHVRVICFDGSILEDDVGLFVITLYWTNGQWIWNKKYLSNNYFYFDLSIAVAA